MGGISDDLVRLVAGITITIPALLVLIIIQSLMEQISLVTMSTLLAIFRLAWTYIGYSRTSTKYAGERLRPNGTVIRSFNIQYHV